jgi:hypothetical protein
MRFAKGWAGDVEKVREALAGKRSNRRAIEGTRVAL